jgi:hypothetical protein
MIDNISAEMCLWFLSMLAVSWSSCRFSVKLSSYDAEKAAIPKVNSVVGSRLFFIISLNYLVVALGCVLMYFTSTAVVMAHILNILDTWWLIEIFLFFNLITFYSIWSAKGKIVVNI